MSSRRPKLLIIDNDEGLVAALQARLEHYGYECITACTGAQGIAIAQEADIDLIITDLNMPLGNGIELATSLRATSNIPIVVITGYREEYRRELRAISNVTILVKPIDPNQLIDVIDAELIMAGQQIP